MQEEKNGSARVYTERDKE